MNHYKINNYNILIDDKDNIIISTDIGIHKILCVNLLKYFTWSLL